MAKATQVHVLLDLGTPTSPIVAVFTNYADATTRQLELQRANPADEAHFIVDTCTVVKAL